MSRGIRAGAAARGAGRAGDLPGAETSSPAAPVQERGRRGGGQAARCYDAILEGILRRRFLPGDRLAPDDLARELGVSRTPVQDALKRLALEGLVQIQPRRGTVVTRVTARDFAEFIDVRLMIELRAAPTAVERATAANLAAIETLVDRLRAVLVATDGRPAPDAWFEEPAPHTIALVMSGIDPVTKSFMEPKEAIKQEIVEVNADTSIGKAQKAKMLQELNRALKDAQPIQHRGNIDLVKSYFEKIEAAVQ